MATDEYNGKPQAEAANDCTLMINGNELSVFRLDTTKEITVEEVRENNVFPIGDAVTEISYSGSMSFKGRRVVVDSYLFDPNTGLPYRDAWLTLTHDLLDENGAPIANGPLYTQAGGDEQGSDAGGDAKPFTETWHDLRAVSAGFEMNQGEITEVSYDWIALSKSPP